MIPCLLSAILLILSFPNFNLWPLAWFAFIPLFFFLQNKNALTRFFSAYLVGVLFFFGTIFWLIHVTLAGMIALVLYLALYFGLFGLFFSLTPYHLPLITLLFLPAVWVLLEYLRGHMLTGLGWVLLGHSQYLNLPIIQISDITGAYGVSFLVMLVNVAVWQIISGAINRRPAPKNKTFFSVVIFCCLSSLVYGYYRLHQKTTGEKIRISVVQGNVPQELKWVREEKEGILEKHVGLSLKAAAGNPDLIIWSETAMPVVLEEEFFLLNAVSGLAREIQKPILTGTMRHENGNYYNSAVLFSPDGVIKQHYDKIHLVPFGEYIPLRKPFVFLERLAPIDDFKAGKEHTLFKFSASSHQSPVKFAVLICFEDIFPELARKFVAQGAGFLVNITNDAWFGKTAASYQHLQSSVFRAIENRIPVVRSANTGISGFIAANGKIISLVKDKTGKNIYISGYDTQEIIIPTNKNLSFYTRFGDVFVLFCLIVFACGIILTRRYRSRKPYRYVAETDIR